MGIYGASQSHLHRERSIISRTGYKEWSKTVFSYPRLLASAERQTPLPDLRLVTSLQEREIRLQRALVEHLFVPLLIHWRAEENVVPDGVVQDPGRLIAVRHAI